MKWYFPSNNHGQVNGIADAGVETFQGTPLKSLAREICQNSLDAAVNGQVVVEFKCFAINTEILPGKDALLDACMRAHDFWKVQKSDRASSFFKKAQQTLNKESIYVLRISDSNTKGLQGSHAEYNTSWSNLIKSSGVSDKNGSSGGSFGIGKFAPFACSFIRTVFYSTFDVDGLTASQGVARLASFKNQDGVITQGIGYYGEHNNTPIFNLMDLDPMYSRHICGTDIYIAGFNYAEQEWSCEIIASILEGFLYAVLKGDLVVRIDGFELNKDTIGDEIRSYGKFVEENNSYIREYAEEYYRVLTSSQTQWFINNDFRTMGGLRLGFLIDDKFHNRVAMIRKIGMKIYDKDRNPRALPFAGVLIVEGQDIDTFLRKLENPQHIKWEFARYTDNPAYAKEILHEINSFIYDSLRSLQVDNGLEAIDADVGDFLPDEIEDGSMKDENKTEVLTDTVKTIEKSIAPTRVARVMSDNQDQQGIKNDEGGTDNVPGSWKKHYTEKPTNGIRDPEPGEGNGETKGKDSQIQPIGSSKTRVFCLNKETGEYSLLFTPVKSAASGVLELYQSAESAMYPAVIKSVKVIGQKDACFDGNRILKLNYNKDEIIKIRITIDYKDYCSMEVKGYGN